MNSESLGAELAKDDKKYQPQATEFSENPKLLTI